MYIIIKSLYNVNSKNYYLSENYDYWQKLDILQDAVKSFI